ncbi:hypothetical protein VTK73DRAFT_1838 [Phialemonium thermophilum]|uniref:Uncharacterized protein n=1 Tax=Phialemonium thermophilum TaxID=223376 RepID=A0ABR3X7F5_9PEZI
MPPPNTPEEGLPVARPSSPSSMSDSQSETRRQVDHGHSSQSTSGDGTPNPRTPRLASSPSIRSTPKEQGPLAPAVPMDYHSLEYQDEVDDTLLCPICHNPFESPVTTKQCGHTFCARCLRRATALQPVCPIDRRPLLAYDEDQLCTARIITDQLDRLRVRCPNRTCDQVTARSLVAAHYERHCPYTPVACPDPLCDRPVARRYVTEERGCLHHAVPCAYCSKMIQAADLDEHHSGNCSGNTVKCEFCSVAVARHRLAEHVSEKCPETEARCKWQSFGCKIAEKRKDIGNHEDDCVYKAIAKLAQARTEDQLLIHDLKGQLAVMECRVRAAELRSSTVPICEDPSPPSWSSSAELVPSLFTAAVAHAESQTRERPDHGSGRGAETSDEYMLAQFERIESKIEDLHKVITELDGRHSMMLVNEMVPVKDQIAELRSNIGVVGMQTTWLLNAQRQSRVAQLLQQQQQQQQQQQAPQNGADSSSTGNRGAAAVVDGTSGRNRSALNDDDGWRVRHASLPPRRLSDGRGEPPPRL